VSGVRLQRVASASGMLQDNHWLGRFGFTLLAGYASGKPVVIPLEGARLDVRIGEGGEVISLARHWYELEFDSRLNLLGDDEAADLARNAGFAGLDLMRSRLVYRLENPDLDQQYVSPYYHLWEEGLQQEIGLIPATTFTPLAYIEISSTEVAAGTVITPTAIVQCGTPPYKYAWFTDQSTSNPLGEAATAVLTATLGSETVVLQVTDAYSQTSRAQVVITGLEPVAIDLPREVEGSARVEQDFEKIGPLAHLPKSSEANIRSRTDWRVGEALVSDDDGLELRNVSYFGDLVASRINIPKYLVHTDNLPPTECDLYHHPPAGDPTQPCLGGAYEFKVEDKPGSALSIVASYQIYNLPNDRPGALIVTLRFMLHATQTDCEPEGLSCNRIQPRVEYTYVGSSDNQLRRVIFYYRLDLDIDRSEPNRAAYVKDHENYARAVVKGIKTMGKNVV